MFISSHNNKYLSENGIYYNCLLIIILVDIFLDILMILVFV
jgi:hypothetical protein